MDDNLRRKIEEFILDYENNAQDVNNIWHNTKVFLETAINLLTEAVNDYDYPPSPPLYEQGDEDER